MGLMMKRNERGCPIPDQKASPCWAGAGSWVGEQALPRPAAGSGTAQSRTSSASCRVLHCPTCSAAAAPSLCQVHQAGKAN